MNVQNSESSPCPRKDAKAVNTTLKKKTNPEDLNLAKFIINKFIIPARIDWGRDIKICYRIFRTKKYKDIRFWSWLPCLKKVDSMIVLDGEKSRLRLKEMYNIWKRQIDLVAKITPEKKKMIALSDVKFGEDKSFTKKIKSIFEFCK